MAILSTTSGAVQSSDFIAPAVNGVSIDSRRRIFNFGERVAELSPTESPFFVYLSKVAKKPTDDPVFKFMEQRHQWQRRYGIVVAVVSSAYSFYTTTTIVHVVSPYDNYGRMLYEAGNPMTQATSDMLPTYFLPNQMVTLRATDGTMCNYYVDTVESEIVSSSNAFNGAKVCKLTLKTPLSGATAGTDYSGKTFAVPVTDGNNTAQTYIQIVGSAFAEATGAPSSWKDELYDREGYCQIFKTAIELFSGTAQATRLRGRPNEFTRVWQEKLREHKSDIEQAMLFQTGLVAYGGTRYSWGILPYTEAYGKVYNFNYGTSNYDSFLDAMQDFFAPESGNAGRKLVLASRKIINWLNRLGKAGYLMNTAGSTSYNLDIQNVTGKFGHKVTNVSTIFGDLAVVQEPFFRNGYEDYAIAIDMNNVAYRPLIGNGINRDTFIKTNVQDNDVDGRQDMITTEAGLEISLPETHAVMKFS